MSRPRLTDEERRARKRESRREYRLKNKDKIREYAREHALKNKDKINARRRERYWENPEKARESRRESNREYALKNKDKINARRREVYWKDPEKSRRIGRKRYWENPKRQGAYTPNYYLRKTGRETPYKPMEFTVSEEKALDLAIEKLKQKSIRELCYVQKQKSPMHDKESVYR